MTSTKASYGAVGPSVAEGTPIFDSGIPDEEKQTESYQMFPTFHEEQLEESSFGKRRCLSVVGVLILATVVALLGVAGYRNYGDLASSAKLEGSKTRFNVFAESQDGVVQITDKDDLNIYATNEYGHFEAPYPWMSSVAGMQLVEPYKTSNLKLQGNYVDSGKYLFNWVIEDYDTTSWFTSFTAQQAVFTFPKPYHVQVQVISASTLEIVALYETVLICK
jgi:hypothetical protein